MTALGLAKLLQIIVDAVHAGDAGKDVLSHTTHLLRALAQDRRDASLDELQELRGRMSLARHPLHRAS